MPYKLCKKCEYFAEDNRKLLKCFKVEGDIIILLYLGKTHVNCRMKNGLNEPGPKADRLVRRYYNITMIHERGGGRGKGRERESHNMFG